MILREVYGNNGDEFQLEEIGKDIRINQLNGSILSDEISEPPFNDYIVEVQRNGVGGVQVVTENYMCHFDEN